MKPRIKIIQEIIEQHGLGHIAHFDGCECGDFELCGITATIICRKSGRGSKGSVPGHAGEYGTAVYVYDRSLDCDVRELAEVARLITPHLYDQRFAVRLCEPEQDAKNACVYCGKARAQLTDYLCAACQSRIAQEPHIARYDGRAFDYASDGTGASI